MPDEQVEACAAKYFRPMPDNSLYASFAGLVEGVVTDEAMTDEQRIAEIRTDLAALDLVIAERRALVVLHGPVRPPYGSPERLTAREWLDKVAPTSVACSPKCSDLNVAGPTGTARSWHSDDCPVPVMHHATDGVTACRVPVADLPRSAGYAPDRDGYITCASCIEELGHSQECREQLEERPCRFDCPARDTARNS
jgi:hypothetical protein